MAKTSKTKAPKRGQLVKVPKGYVNEGRPVPYAGVSIFESEEVTTTKLTGTTDTTSFDQKLTDLGFTKAQDFGDRIVDIGQSPFMRAKDLTVNAHAFMPNAQVYPFFDDVDVSAYCKPQSYNAFGVTTSTGSLGAPLITDGKGSLRCVFKLPEGKFKSGDRVFRLTTSPKNESSPPPASFAEAKYHSVGYVGQKQHTTYSTRVPKVDITMTQKTHNPAEMSSSVTAFSAPCPRDPIAQSFFVYEDGGCFITAVDVFFYQKPGDVDATKPTPPLIFQVRELDDGGNPSNKILPFGEIVKQVEDVITNKVDLVLGRLTVNGNKTITGIPGVTAGPWTAADPVRNDSGVTITGVTITSGNVIALNAIALSANPVDDMIPTRFTFPSPVYVSQNESYCFVLISDSDEYKVWVAQSGPDITSREDSANELWRKAGETNTNIGTNDPISKDPYIQGVFFKSQNGISWTPDQTIDLKFTIWKAQFDTAINGEVVFVNEQLPLRTLPLDPIETKTGSSLIRILHPHHGMCVAPSTASSRVLLSGISGGTNGLNLSVLQQPEGHLLVSVEMDYYIVDLGVGNTATSTGRIGGPIVKATENKRFEEALFLCNPLLFPQTNVTWSLKPTSSKGVSDITNTPYLLQEAFNIASDITLTFDKPMHVSSHVNERYALEPLPGPSPVATTGLGDKKSLHLTAVLSSQNQNISPVLDISRISLALSDYRLDDPAGNIPLGSEVLPSQVINTVFDGAAILPSTDAPVVASAANKVHFSTSRASLSGVSVSSSGVTLSGALTIFLSELEPGDIIKDSLSGEERTVIAITDNITLTLDAAFSTNIPPGTATPFHEPDPVRLKTAVADVAVHLSKLHPGKLVTLTGATGDRVPGGDVYVLEVNYTPTNADADSDLGGLSCKCDVVLDYRPKQPAGFETLPFNLIQKDRYVDEIAPGGNSCSSRYICKKMSLLQPANSLKIMFDGHRDETCDIVTYYRLDTVQDQTPLESKNWTLAEYNIDTGGQLETLTPSPNSDAEEFSSYEVNLLNIPEFTGVQVKIVFRGGNPARMPRVKAFRIIATEE